MPMAAVKENAARNLARQALKVGGFVAAVANNLHDEQMELAAEGLAWKWAGFCACVSFSFLVISKRHGSQRAMAITAKMGLAMAMANSIQPSVHCLTPLILMPASSSPSFLFFFFFLHSFSLHPTGWAIGHPHCT